MVKTALPRRIRSPRRDARPQPRPFRQRELWDSLEPPVEVADAIRTLSALRERFEQALAVDRARA